jgi:hypothetical protein
MKTLIIFCFLSALFILFFAYIYEMLFKIKNHLALQISYIVASILLLSSIFLYIIRAIIALI